MDANTGQEVITKIVPTVKEASVNLLKAGKNAYKASINEKERVDCLHSVADYLEACSVAQITEQTIPNQVSEYADGERRFFDNRDWEIWKSMARVMRNPELANPLEIIGTLAGLRSQADRFEGTKEKNPNALYTWVAYKESWRLLNEQSGNHDYAEGVGVVLP